MTQGVKGREGERMRRGGACPKLPAGTLRTARLKLSMLTNARALDDLRVQKGDRLEALKANRAGRHGIRSHRPFRIRFLWQYGHAFGVEIVDYH